MAFRKAISALLIIALLIALPATALGAGGGFIINNGILERYTGPGGAVHIPNSVTAIGYEAFRTRTNITSVTMPDSVEVIGDYAFTYCSRMSSIEIGIGVRTIGEWAFWHCKALTNIVIPDSVETIGFNAFREATQLKDVTIGSGVTEIGAYAFAYCRSIEVIDVPPSVTIIGENAFIDHDEFKMAIRGTPGSVAEAYASENGHVFIVSGSATAPQQSTPAAPQPSTPQQSAPAPSGGQPSQWAQANVTTAIGLGLVPSNLQSGYSQSLTRAEFCALVVALYEQLVGTIAGRKTFSDTNDVNVQKAAFIGVVGGVGGNMFNPAGTLTREQAATMLARLADAVGSPLPSQQPGFSDSGNISRWALESVGKVNRAGIMDGTGSNRFSPKGTYTREQGITTILRLFNIAAEQMDAPMPVPAPAPAPAPQASIPSFDSFTFSDSIKRGTTPEEFKQAFDVAAVIAAKYAGQPKEDQLRGVYAEIRHLFDTKITYSMTEKHYNSVYGYFIANVASCAGSVRATGLVLTILGFEYEHVNENQASHQWPRVRVDGGYWIVDSFMLYVGPEPGPYTHPRIGG